MIHEKTIWMDTKTVSLVKCISNSRTCTEQWSEYVTLFPRIFWDFLIRDFLQDWKCIYGRIVCQSTNSRYSFSRLKTRIDIYDQVTQ